MYNDIMYEVTIDRPFKENDIGDYLTAIDIARHDEFLTEEAKEFATNPLSIEVMDTEKFIKANKCAAITNPNFFIKEGVPSPDGLLSNEIFGITQEDRAGIFGYVDLCGTFMDPSCYKVWARMDSRIKNIVHGTKSYIINADGELEESEEGYTGIDFLKDNFTKLNFRSTDSRKRDIKIEYITHNYKKGRLFLTKYIVIPAYYRDVNTTGKYVGVGEINKLYSSLIIAAKSLKETQDYGLPMADTTTARMQENLVTIYDWFCGNRNSRIVDKGVGMSGKFGIIRRANLAYTSDYSSRLVMSAPELKVETVDDLMVTLDNSAMPLAAVVADFYPFITFHMRRFFENEFLGTEEYSVIYNGEVVHLKLDDPMIEFSDERIKKELKRFLHGYSNRFINIEVPVKPGQIPEGSAVYMKFKGKNTNDEDYGKNPESLTQRDLTWCDIIYMAAVEATKDKKILITRFPIDSIYNTFVTGIEVSSTKETEPMYVDNTYYRFYPKIRQENINKDTSNTFIDTMMICNLFLKGIGGDYDGDQVTVKGAFFEETNEELTKHMSSKINYVNFGCQNIRVSSNEAVQCLYNLTQVLKEDKGKLTAPIF